MTRIQPCLAFAVLAVAAHGAPAPFLKPSGPHGLVGEWRQVAVEFDGVDLWPSEKATLNRWLITKDSITIMMRGKKSGGTWSYRLHPGQNPAGIDLTPMGTRITYPSLFRVEGDLLTLCCQNFPERGRPKDFVSRKGSGVCRFVYVRMRPGEYERLKE